MDLKMIEWQVSKNLVPYEQALEEMEARVNGITDGRLNQMIWCLEHSSLFTGGTSSKDTHILHHKLIPVHQTSRGGSYTYHGPGQRVVYVMLDLKKHDMDIRKFVWSLEEWIIKTLYEFGIHGYREKDLVGIWVPEKNKIASIGLRVRKWVTFFGLSVNINPELKYFNSIIPCGNVGYGVTSMANQGVFTSLDHFDKILKNQFFSIFEN